MTLSCSICLEKIGDSDAVAIPCGHVFDRYCIMACLSNRTLCPLCNKPSYTSQIFSLYITTDNETDKLIQDLQNEINIKSGKIGSLEDLIRKEKAQCRSIISTKEREYNNTLQGLKKEIELLKTEISQLKKKNDNKEKEYINLQNDYKVMRINVNSKQATLNSLKENCVTFKSERDEKIKMISKLETELEEFRKSSCNLDKYEESKTKYKGLLNRFEKIVDENVSIKKSMETLKEKISLENGTVKTSSSSKSDESNVELSSIIEKLTHENQLLKDNKEDKAKYNKLLDSFERLVDEKTAINHEKIKLEQQLAEERDKSQLSKEFTECQRELDNINLTLTDSLKKNIALTDLTKKLQESNEMLLIEHKNILKENTNLKTGNVKLIAQKNKAYNELDKLKKKPSKTTKMDSTTANVVNLSIPNNNNDLEKELQELRITKNKLLKESSRYKTKADNIYNENQKMHVKIKSYKETIEKQKQELKLKSPKLGILNQTKAEEMKLLCTKLMDIANLCTE